MSTSIILPTIRPDDIIPKLNLLLWTSTRKFEVIVIADFKYTWGPLDHRIKWIFQEQRQGPIYAINEGFKFAQYDHILVMNDESTLLKFGIDLLEDAYRNNDLQLLTPKHEPYFPFYYYGKYFAAFPFMNRKTLYALNNNEYVFDPVYKGFYADPDLSMRAHAQNIPVNVVETVPIWHKNDMKAIGHQENVLSFLEHDRTIFKNRWNHLGEFKDP